MNILWCAFCTGQYCNEGKSADPQRRHTVYTWKRTYMWHALGVYTTPPPIKPPTNYTQRLNQGFLSFFETTTLPFAGSWWRHPVGIFWWCSHEERANKQEVKKETVSFKLAYAVQPLTKTICCLLLFAKPLLFPFCLSYGIFAFLLEHGGSVWLSLTLLRRVMAAWRRTCSEVWI